MIVTIEPGGIGEKKKKKKRFEMIEISLLVIITTLITILYSYHEKILIPVPDIRFY